MLFPWKENFSNWSDGVTWKWTWDQRLEVSNLTSLLRSSFVLHVYFLMLCHRWEKFSPLLLIWKPWITNFPWCLSHPPTNHCHFYRVKLLCSSVIIIVNLPVERLVSLQLKIVGEQWSVTSTQPDLTASVSLLGKFCIKIKGAYILILMLKSFSDFYNYYISFKIPPFITVYCMLDELLWKETLSAQHEKLVSNELIREKLPL